VIQFITRCSNSYREKFLPTLQNASYGTDVRVAIIRYYKKYIYEPVRPILIEFVVNSTDVNLTIESINTLAVYPALDTITTLKDALSSHRWQIRYSASAALVELLKKQDLLKLLQGEHNYTREIIDYMLERKDILQSAPLPLTLHKEMDGEQLTI